MQISSLSLKSGLFVVHIAPTFYSVTFTDIVCDYNGNQGDLFPDTFHTPVQSCNSGPARHANWIKLWGAYLDIRIARDSRTVVWLAILESCHSVKLEMGIL